jgi:hypothetical protein
VTGADAYIVRWRRTDAANWDRSLRVDTSDSRLCEARPEPAPEPVRAGTVRRGPVKCRAVLKGIRVDDWVFGVSSIAKDGSESPVASAVPGGAFRPWSPPPASPQ